MPEPKVTDAPPVSPESPPIPAPPAAQPKLEIKDGVVMVDGKKFVPESQLMAAKESLQKDIDKAQQIHNDSVDKLKLDLSASQSDVAKANVALDEAKKARMSGDISAEELSKIKKEAEDAKANFTAEQTAGLDYRRKYIIAAYSIPATSDVAKKLSEKTAAQLDSFEEALKALSTSRGGPGNYAVSGGSGGATVKTNMDRAKELISSTPYRGIRNTPDTKV